MVYSGRPSDACHPCRKRRLRCDRLQPGCTQCARKNMTCPGYRDPADFYFVDETANAAFKVQNRKPRRRVPDDAVVARSSSDPDPNHAASSSTCTTGNTAKAPAKAPTTGWSGAAAAAAAAGPRTKAVGSRLGTLGTLVTDPPSELALVRHHRLCEPTDDLARTYFMTEYIPSSPFEYLPRLFPRGFEADDAMSSAVTAASFASLSLKLSDKRLMKQARLYYAKALSQTNQALGRPDLAVEDATLAAVLLLALFEAIIFTGQKSLDTWNAHTIGSVELVRLRGTRQLETPLGRKLFAHSSNNIRTSCAHTKTPVPSRILQLSSEDAKLQRDRQDQQDPFLKIVPVVDRVARLRCRVAAMDDRHRREWLLEALELDADTVELGHDNPAEWRFTVRPAGESAAMSYKGVSLKYPSLRALRYWNGLRINRMFLNELIWVQASLALKDGVDDGDGTDYEELKRTASRNMLALIVEVLASCGEYLGSSRDRFPVAARCLIWPLSVIAEAPLTPRDARDFAVDCLDRLARECWIPQAMRVATRVRGLEGTDWLHFYYLA